MKICTKCSGQMITQQDMYGRYRSCMQCGRHEDIAVITDVEEEALGGRGYYSSLNADTLVHLTNLKFMS